MGEKKQVGKFFEKRGDDYFVANVTTDRSVTEIVQRDAIGHSYPAINFWTESAPQMIELIQKAAGIKPEAKAKAKTTAEVEYEYNIESTDLITGRVWVWRTLWEPDTEWLQRKLDVGEENDRKLLNAGGTLEYKRRMVKRTRPGKTEAV